jgi:hypothetical protein
MRYVSPAFNLSAFNCPHCDAYSKMEWGKLSVNRFGSYRGTPVSTALCAHCNQSSYWVAEKTGVVSADVSEDFSGRMIEPAITTAPMPHVEMPDAVKGDFEEARLIAGTSPRGAAALLRLCIQKLCVELGQKGKNINDDIAALVAAGLPLQVQQALDVVRVVGNNAVHPGEMSEDDLAEVCHSLFELVNHIVEDRIARPKQYAAMYERLPSKAKDGIELRDRKPAAA